MSSPSLKDSSLSSSSTPYVFDEFFESGLEESISPFLTPSSRKWSKDLSLKNALFSAALLVLAFLLPSHGPFSNFLLAFVYLFVGTPALLHAIEDLKSLEINIDMLMTFSALTSLVLGNPFEGALLLVLFNLSRALEKTASLKTKNAVYRLHSLSPNIAFVVGADGSLSERSVKEIEIGTQILIKAGDIIPLDGVITAGSSSINLSHLTGEATPVLKNVGEEVPAGAQNLEGALTISVSRSSSQSALAKIIQLLTQAQETKPKIQRWIDLFGKTYSSLLIGLTFLLALCLPLFFSLPYLGNQGSIYRALTFMITASPCALILATSTAYLSSLSACTRKGILLKGGTVLDGLCTCSSIAFDKTGTLTTGQLQCISVEPLSPSSPFSISEALSIAEALERNSTHPIATAISLFAKENMAPYLPVKDFRSAAGFGLQGKVSLNTQSVNAFIGLPSYIASLLSEQNPALAHNLELSKEKKEIVAVLLVNQSLFLFRFADFLKPEAKETMEQLQQQFHLTPIILTGDNEKNAQAVAHSLGISQVYANLRPENKLALITELSKKGPLAMVGDGINDAPALARAAIGIAMGKIGSKSAITASDVLLLNDDLSLLVWLFSKAKDSLTIVKENIFFALAVICFASTPALLGFIPLWLAVLLHEGGTLLVGLNSLRLIKTR